MAIFFVLQIYIHIFWGMVFMMRVYIWMGYFSSGTTVSNCRFFTFTNQTETLVFWSTKISSPFLWQVGVLLCDCYTMKINHPTIYQFINIRCTFTHNIYKLTFWKNRIIFSTDKMFYFKITSDYSKWKQL
jgi:hypothetical protein